MRTLTIDIDRVADQMIHHGFETPFKGEYGLEVHEGWSDAILDILKVEYDIEARIINAMNERLNDLRADSEVSLSKIP